MFTRVIIQTMHSLSMSIVPLTIINLFNGSKKSICFSPILSFNRKSRRFREQDYDMTYEGYLLLSRRRLLWWLSKPAPPSFITEKQFSILIYFLARKLIWKQHKQKELSRINPRYNNN